MMMWQPKCSLYIHLLGSGNGVCTCGTQYEAFICIVHVYAFMIVELQSHDYKIPFKISHILGVLSHS